MEAVVAARSKQRSDRKSEEIPFSCNAYIIFSCYSIRLWMPVCDMQACEMSNAVVILQRGRNR